MVAVKAAPGDKDVFDPLDCMAEGPGDGERPFGDVPIAEGGGEVPRSEDRNPPPEGLARMVLFIGGAGRGEGGASVALLAGMGDPAPRVAALPLPLAVSSARMVWRDPAELKLEIEPLASLPRDPFRPLDGVPS